MDKPTCKLIGENGLCDRAEEMSKRIMEGEATSYDEALRIIMEYVEIE